MQTQPGELTQDAIHYFACRCSHCFRPIAAYAIGTTRTVYCDEHCARADAALQDRLREAAQHRARARVLAPQPPPAVPARSTAARVAWIGLQVLGAPVPILAVLYLLRRYL